MSGRAVAGKLGRFRDEKLNHQPSTISPQHSTLKTQHSTLNTQHSTLNTQNSKLKTQNSTLTAPAAALAATRVIWCRYAIKIVNMQCTPVERAVQEGTSDAAPPVDRRAVGPSRQNQARLGTDRPALEQTSILNTHPPLRQRWRRPGSSGAGTRHKSCRSTTTSCLSTSSSLSRASTNWAAKTSHPDILKP